MSAWSEARRTVVGATMVDKTLRAAALREISQSLRPGMVDKGIHHKQRRDFALSKQL